MRASRFLGAVTQQVRLGGGSRVLAILLFFLVEDAVVNEGGGGAKDKKIRHSPRVQQGDSILICLVQTDVVMTSSFPLSLIISPLPPPLSHQRLAVPLLFTFHSATARPRWQN